MNRSRSHCQYQIPNPSTPSGLHAAAVAPRLAICTGMSLRRSLAARSQRSPAAHRLRSRLRKQASKAARRSIDRFTAASIDGRTQSTTDRLIPFTYPCITGGRARSPLPIDSFDPAKKHAYHSHSPPSCPAAAPHPKANASPSSSTTAACRTSGRPNWRSWSCGYVSLCVIRSV